MPTKVYSRRYPQSSPVLAQKNPEDGGKTRRGFRNHTTQGYLDVGRRRRTHLLINSKAIATETNAPFFYPYAAVVTINVRLDPRDYSGLIKHLTKTYQALGCTVSGEVEISKGNVVQLNLIFGTIPEELILNNFRKLKAAIRSATTIKLNQQYNALTSYQEAKTTIGYFSKLVFSKEDDPDIYKDKRVLFVKLPKGQRINRFFATKGFWVDTPTRLTQRYRAEKRKRQALRDQFPKAEEAAREHFKQFPGEYVKAEVVEDGYYKTLTNGTADEIEALNSEINALAEDWYGGPLELQDALVKKKADRDYRKQAIANRRKKGVKTKPKPFNPADLESFNPHGIA